MRTVSSRACPSMKSAEGRRPSALNRAYSSVPEIVRQPDRFGDASSARPLLVRAVRPRPSLAPHARSVPRSRQRGDAATDAGLPRSARVPAVSPAVPDAASALPRSTRQGSPRVVGPWLQPPREGPASCRADARLGLAANRRRTRRSSRGRRVHGVGGRVLRIRRADGFRRHEHPTRARPCSARPHRHRSGGHRA